MSSKTDKLSRDLYLNLVRLHDQLSAEFTALFKEAGLTQAQFNVLRIVLGGNPEGVPCQYIGERLLQRVPDVTRLLDRMVAAGLVERERSTSDRRVVLIRVTPKGRGLVEELAQPVLALHRRQLKGLPVKRLQDLNATLVTLLENRME